MTAPRTRLAMLAPLALLACSGPSEPTQHVRPGDPELYASYVQPYVEVGCATLDCHGDPGHPLRLYSELGLRKAGGLRTAPISETHDPVALTDAELEDNRLSFAAIALATDTPAEHLALLKPLAVGAGGIAHEGPVLWTSTGAPGYRCLRAYLVAGDDGDAASQCAEALDELQARTPPAE